jgi:hypothetical protein
LNARKFFVSSFANSPIHLQHYNLYNCIRIRFHFITKHTLTSARIRFSWFSISFERIAAVGTDPSSLQLV